MMRLFLWILLSGMAMGQLARYDVPFPQISGSSPPYLIASLPPNSPVVSVCNSPANEVPCTNYATTYTASNVACPNGAQDTPQPATTSSCQVTGDAEGNIGFWVAPGTYDYTVCIGDNCYGPYTITLQVALLPLQTNGVNNANQNLLNFVNSSTNAAGIAITSSNPSGGNEKFEATISNKQTAMNAIAPTSSAAGDIIYNNGSNWVILAGNTTTSNCLTESSSGVPSWGSCGGGGGTVTGSGTAGKSAGWSSSSALTSTSLWFQNASVPNLGIFGSSLGAALSSNNAFEILTLGNGSCTVGSTPEAIPGPTPACYGQFIQSAGSNTASTSGFTSLWVQNGSSGLSATTNAYVNAALFQANTVGTTPLEVRAVEIDAQPGGQGVTTSRGLVVTATNSGSGTRTNTTQQAMYAQTLIAGSATTTNDYDLYLDSPNITSGTLTNHYGLFIADQTVAGGGTNSNPIGINEANLTEKNNLGVVALGGHLNQQATGKFAGTCAMSAATTCTFSIATAYSGTPVGVCSIDAASAVPATANSCKVSVSGTTVTITAGASNSLTWDAILVGNPN